MSGETIELKPTEDQPIEPDAANHSANNNDPTHPRGNVELAEQMAHSEVLSRGKAMYHEYMADSSRAFRTGAVETNLGKAEIAKRRADRDAETTRQQYLRANPEIAAASDAAQHLIDPNSHDPR